MITEHYNKDEAYILLEKIRQKAPWIPVIAYTQHLDQGKLTYEISKRSYDAILPKKFIKRDSSFCLELFDQIVETAISNRQSIINSYDYKFLNNKKNEIKLINELEIEADEKSLNFFNEHFSDSFKVNRFFYFNFPNHYRFIIRKLSDGFSGNQVFKIIAFSREQKFGKESYWFMKAGNKITELYWELNAYMDIKNAGLHHQYFPPLLHDGIIVQDSVGALVYQLEKDCTTLEKKLSDIHIDLYNTTIKNLFLILKEIQMNNSFEIGLVKHHFIKKEKIISLYDKIKETNDISSILTNEENINKFMNIEVKYCKGLIHGDFHNRNIMVNTERIYLIDFANADYKPVVFDAIKLELDTINALYNLNKFDKKLIFKLIQSKLFLNDTLADAHEIYSNAIRKSLLNIYTNIDEKEWLIGNFVMSIKFASYNGISFEMKKMLLERAKNIFEHCLNNF